MKHRTIGAGILSLALLTMMVAPVRAEIPRVGVVDMFKVSENYDRYREARQVLERRKVDLQTLVDDEEKDVLSLIEELEMIRATAGQNEVTRRRSEIERRDRELRQFVLQTNIQFRDELDTLQLRARNEIETVVIHIATGRGLTLVLEKNMTLFTADFLDITDAVVAELNARFRPLPTTSAERPRPAAVPAADRREGESERRGWPFRD